MSRPNNNAADIASAQWVQSRLLGKKKIHPIRRLLQVTAVQQFHHHNPTISEVHSGHVSSHVWASPPPPPPWRPVVKQRWRVVDCRCRSSLFVQSISMIHLWSLYQVRSLVVVNCNRYQIMRNCRILSFSLHGRYTKVTQIKERRLLISSQLDSRGAEEKINNKSRRTVSRLYNNTGHNHGSCLKAWTIIVWLILKF